MSWVRIWARAAVVSSGRNVVKRPSACPRSEKVAHAVGLGQSVLLIGLVLYRVLQVRRQRRVAQAVGLGRRNVGTVVSSGRVHGRSLKARRLWRLGRSDGVRGDMTRSAASVGSQARLALLDLALDAATIGRLADLRQDGAHGLDEVHAQVRRSKLEGSLDDIVAVRIAHELLELLDVEKLLDHDSLGGNVGAANTLLDHVGAELLLGEFGNLARKANAQRIGEARIIQVENVLHDVVAEGILDKVEAVRGDLANQLDLLEAIGMVNAALKDAAAMAVGANCDAVLTNGVEDELGILGLEVVQTLLDDVVTVQVLD